MAAIAGGRTLRIAFKPCGPAISAGKSLSPCAPSCSAPNASLGVNTPGINATPSARPSSMTRTSVFGMTNNSAPAPTAATASDGESTVPAPTTAFGETTRLISEIASSARGPLSGTSRIRNPVSVKIRAIACARSGTSPRKIATSGISSVAWRKRSPIFLMRHLFSDMRVP